MIHAGLLLTRVNSGEEFVSDTPAHWAMEAYIPLVTGDLVDGLLRREDCPQGQGPRLREVFSVMGDLLHHRNRPLHTAFAGRYAALDPDRDSLPLAQLGTDVSTNGEDPASIAALEIAEASRGVLADAGFTEIDRKQVEQAVGIASEWGVPLHVDFEVFELLLVYGRGDIVGTRKKRRWSHFFREVMIDVPLYQRVIVIFKLREGRHVDDELNESRLHLRMFKNIPKQDIDMLLPGTRIRISWFDFTRALAPAVGGIGLTIYKILRVVLFVAVMTYSIAAMVIALSLAIIGYLVRGVVNHFSTRNRYMLNLNRSLYYQKLDTNAGVAYRLLAEAESQRHREAILAYFALYSAAAPISQRRLRRRSERIVRELANVEVAFRVADAIASLGRWNLIQRDSEGLLSVVSPDEAMRRLEGCWDQAVQAS